MVSAKAVFSYHYSGESDDRKSLLAALRYKERDTTPVRLVIDGLLASASAEQVAYVANNMTKYAPSLYPIRLKLNFIPSIEFCFEFVRHCDGIVVPILELNLDDAAVIGYESLRSKLELLRPCGIKLSLSFMLTKKTIALGSELVSFVRTMVSGGISVSIALPDEEWSPTAQRRYARFVTENGLSFLMAFLSSGERINRFKVFQDSVVKTELSVPREDPATLLRDDANYFSYPGYSTPQMSALEMLRVEAHNYRLLIDKHALLSVSQILLSNAK